MMAETKKPVIDIDSHVEEPEEAWAYLPERYADRRPFPVVARDLPALGGLNAFWYVDGVVYPKPVGRGTLVYGTPTLMRFAREKHYSLGSQTLTDVEARLRDMDAAGFDVQVIFPTVFLQPLTDDLLFEAALMRSYNTWMGKTCARRPDRLKWAAVVPLRDPRLGIDELHHARGLGATVVCLFGTAGEVMLHDRYLDPFFAEVERLGMPVGVHAGWSHPGITRSIDDMTAARAVSFALPVMMGFYSFVAGGILERHPAIRVAFLEIGAQWVPYLVQRIDHYHHADRALGYPLPVRRPARDTLRECQVYFTPEAEEIFLPQVAEYLGEDRLLFEGDMPHAEAREGAKEEILARTDLSDALKWKILSDNGRRFLGL
jgi:predicted TIM-barrel fold metal-dependent hydrolase